MTTVQAMVMGNLRGQSGREYVVIGAQGDCDECGAPFGVRSVIAPTDPVPAVRFVHDGPGTHHIEMTGDSDAARALREGKVIATESGGLQN